MMFHEVLEGLMLLSFSIGWYWSIARMIRVRAAIGKSVFFVGLVCMGYATGVVSQIAEWQTDGTLSPLVWLYAWNVLVTAVDLSLVVYFTRGGGRRPATA
ncbi:MAG: hypothetical protein AAGI50_07420 [Pseudomonadota bacterium]